MSVILPERERERERELFTLTTVSILYSAMQCNVIFNNTKKRVFLNSYQIHNVYPFSLHVQNTYGVSMGITRYTRVQVVTHTHKDTHTHLE